VGTEKRERQKANKALRAQEEARATTRSRYIRFGLIGAGALIAVFALVYVINAASSDDEATTADTQAEVADTTASDTSDTSDASDTESTEASDDGSASAAGAASGDEVIPEGCPPAEGTDEQTQTFDEAPPFCLDPAVSYTAIVTTNKGEFTIALDQEKAPNTVNNFVYLARNQYFDETTCHRIIPGFVVQCGDPTATGTGGPGYEFEDELPDAGEYEIGSIAMANSGEDTNGSQFFIITGEQGAGLPPQYSLFGAVDTGFDDTVVVMEASGTASGEPGEDVVIERVVITTA
jgi:cyclophilin family peptidyl-prolyl cis-trans isomerase